MAGELSRLGGASVANPPDLWGRGFWRPSWGFPARNADGIEGVAPPAPALSSWLASASPSPAAVGAFISKLSTAINLIGTP